MQAKTLANLATDLKLCIFILNIKPQKLIFVLEGYMILDMSKPVLLIILFTEMCDMSYQISYLTQAELIILMEIVTQSSCMSRNYSVANLMDQYPISMFSRTVHLPVLVFWDVCMSLNGFSIKTVDRSFNLR